MSLTTSLQSFPPSEAAFMSLPAGHQYPAEINQIYVHGAATSTSTKHDMTNVVGREFYPYSISNRNLEQLAAVATGLNCKNANTLGGRPDKSSAQFGGNCSGPRYPYSANAGVTIAMDAEARQSPERYADRLMNQSLGEMDVQTQLLGAPPAAVGYASSAGTIQTFNGQNSFTGLSGMNYPPAIYASFYSPLPSSSGMMVGSCAPSQNNSVSFCNNGQQ